MAFMVTQSLQKVYIDISNNIHVYSHKLLAHAHVDGSLNPDVHVANCQLGSGISAHDSESMLRHSQDCPHVRRPLDKEAATANHASALSTVYNLQSQFLHRHMQSTVGLIEKFLLTVEM